MKINYNKINWNASTYWEFCGTKENLRTVFDRCRECSNIQSSIEEFAYNKPRIGFAFAKGDIVTYRAPHMEPRYATVYDNDWGCTGSLYIRLANGDHISIHPDNIPSFIAIADIPEELVALARAEAGKPIDFSECPLRYPACIKEETK